MRERSRSISNAASSSIELCESSTSASDMWGEHATLGRFLDERGIGCVQQHDHRARCLADDLADEVQCVLGAVAQSDQRHDRPLASCDRADIFDWSSKAEYYQWQLASTLGGLLSPAPALGRRRRLT
jgi:hypothetical protein